MKAASDKTSEIKNHYTSNKATQTSGGSGKAYFEDNRPETAQLQKLQGMANESQQVLQLKPLQIRN